MAHTNGGSAHAKAPFHKTPKKKRPDADAPPSQPTPPAAPSRLGRQKQQSASPQIPKLSSTTSATSPPPPFPIDVIEVSKLPPILQTSLHKPSVLQYARNHELLRKHKGTLRGEMVTKYLGDVRAHAKKKGLANSVVDECVREASAAVSGPVKKDIESELGIADLALSQDPVAPSFGANGKAEPVDGGNEDKKRSKKKKDKKKKGPQEQNGSTVAREPKAVASLPAQYIPNAVPENSEDKHGPSQKKQKKRKREPSVVDNAYDEQDRHNIVVEDGASESHATSNVATSDKQKWKATKQLSKTYDGRNDYSNLPPKKKLKRNHQAQSPSPYSHSQNSRMKSKVDKALHKQKASQKHSQKTSEKFEVTAPLNSPNSFGPPLSRVADVDQKRTGNQVDRMGGKKHNRGAKKNKKKTENTKVGNTESTLSATDLQLPHQHNAKTPASSVDRSHTTAESRRSKMMEDCVEIAGDFRLNNSPRGLTSKSSASIPLPDIPSSKDNKRRRKEQAIADQSSASATQPSTLKRKWSSSPSGDVTSTSPIPGKSRLSQAIMDPSLDIKRAVDSIRGQHELYMNASSGSDDERSSTPVAQIESHRLAYTPSMALEDASPADAVVSPVHDAGVNIGQQSRKKARLRESVVEQENLDESADSPPSMVPDSSKSESDDDNEATATDFEPLGFEFEAAGPSEVCDTPQKNQSPEKGERKDFKAVELETTPQPSDSEAEDFESEAENTQKTAASESSSDVQESETDSSDEDLIGAQDDSWEKPGPTPTSFSQLSDQRPSGSSYGFENSQSQVPHRTPSILRLLPPKLKEQPVKEPPTEPPTFSPSSSESSSSSSSSSSSDSDSESDVGKSGKKFSSLSKTIMHAGPTPLRFGNHSVQQPSASQARNDQDTEDDSTDPSETESELSVTALQDDVRDGTVKTRSDPPAALPPADLVKGEGWRESHSTDRESSDSLKGERAQNDAATPTLRCHPVEQTSQSEVESKKSDAVGSKTSKLDSSTSASDSSESVVVTDTQPVPAPGTTEPMEVDAMVEQAVSPERVDEECPNIGFHSDQEPMRPSPVDVIAQALPFFVEEPSIQNVLRGSGGKVDLAISTLTERYGLSKDGTQVVDTFREEKKGKQRKLKGARADDVSLFGTSSAALEGDEGPNQDSAEKRWKQSGTLSSHFNTQKRPPPPKERQCRPETAQSLSPKENSLGRARKSTPQSPAVEDQPFLGFVRRRSQKAAKPLPRRVETNQLPPPESPSESEELDEKPAGHDMPFNSPVTRSQSRTKLSATDASASPLTLSGPSRTGSNDSIGNRSGLRSSSTKRSAVTKEAKSISSPASETGSVGRFVCVKILKKPQSLQADKVLTYDAYDHEDEEDPLPEDDHRYKKGDQQAASMQDDSDAGESDGKERNNEDDLVADMGEDSATEEDDSVADEATPSRPVHSVHFGQVADPVDFGDVVHDADNGSGDDESEFNGFSIEDESTDAKGPEADDNQEYECDSTLRRINEAEQPMSSDRSSSVDDSRPEQLHKNARIASTRRWDTMSPPKTLAQSIDRSRRGTSEDYPWISGGRRDASVGSTKPKSQFPGSGAVQLPSIPSGPEIMKEQSDLDSRASSYDHEPKGFLRPDGSLSAQKRRTSLRSPHFASTPDPLKTGRPPAGTVSSLPFPSVKASRFGLIQEELAHRPFQLLIAVMFLNKTKGSSAIPKFRQFIAQYPTPDDLAHANVLDITAMLRPLGLQNVRAIKLIEFAKRWLLDPPQSGRRHRSPNYPTKGVQRDIKPGEILDDADPRTAAYEIAHLPGCGPYALDSWRIFCRDALRGVALDWNGGGAGDEGFEPEWKRVRPGDKELRAFLRWMWLRDGWMWDPETGERNLANSEEVKVAEEKWRWDQGSGEDVWIEGGVDKSEAIAEGARDPDAALSPNSPARDHGFHGFVEGDEAGTSTSDTDSTDGLPGVGSYEGDSSSQLAAAQLVREASLSQSRLLTQASANQPIPRSPFPTSVASVIGDGEVTENVTDSETGTSTDDDDATSDRDGGSSPCAPLAGMARMFRRWEREAKWYFSGEVDETPQPESPTKRVAGEADGANKVEIDSLSSPIEYRSGDEGHEDGDVAMEGVGEGSARQASPEL
ncbi:hypothetical protein SLS58_010132 [Diplodia intermedia]|uniref:HhH-GPD domain-containing protein n=1 Tax=Diplodia intermedia TaxID=856260 RepID=A0ABR3T8R0_9PEZI